MSKTAAQPLPCLRPSQPASEWEDKTGPMQVYRSSDPEPPARKRPAMRRVDLSIADADWAARLVQYAVDNLGHYLSPSEEERADALVRKLRGEV